MGLGAWSEGATPPAADVSVTPAPEAAHAEPHPAKHIKRRAADPTDAPSVAFAIGPQPKAPRQLGPAPAALPAPLPPEPEESPLLRDAATELPGSPTLVALVEPAPVAPPRDLAAAAPPAPSSPPLRSATKAQAAPASPPVAGPSPAGRAPSAAAPTATLPADDATEDWLPPKRRSPLPLLLGATALVIVVGLALTLRGGDPAPPPAEVSALDPAPAAPAPLAGAPTASEPPARLSAPAPAPPTASPPAPAAASGSAAPAPSAPAPAPVTAAAPVEPAEDDGWSQPAAPVVAEEKPAQVTVTGDVSRVILQGNGGAIQLSNGPVPPGRYDIYVRFEGRADQAAGKAGTLTVSAGEKVTLHCDQLFAECRRK
jgi:hypothetical protein